MWIGSLWDVMLGSVDSVAGTRLRRLRITRRIGQGTMDERLAAVDEGLDR